MSFLLDTPVISELVKRMPNRNVLAWVDSHEKASFLSVVTLGEIQKGVSKLNDSARKAALQSWLSHDLATRFRGRVLRVDSAVALTWGTLQGEAEREGRTLPVIDCLLAATARVHDLIVVTRNVRDLASCGATVFDPWETAVTDAD